MMEHYVVTLSALIVLLFLAFFIMAKNDDNNKFRFELWKSSILHEGSSQSLVLVLLFLLLIAILFVISGRVIGGYP